MRLLPNEWEGASPLLPKTPDSFLPAARFLDGMTLFGVLGLSWGLGRKAFNKVFFRKHPQEPYLLWRTIGSFTAFGGVSYVFNIGYMRRLRKKEASIILNEAGIPMPKFKLWEHTKKPTRDDLTITLGLATVISSLALQRRRPTPMPGLAILGQANIYMAVGRWGLLLWDKQYLSTMESSIDQWKVELAAASKRYTAQTGKPPPAILFGKPDLHPTVKRVFEGALQPVQQPSQSLMRMPGTSNSGSFSGSPHPFDPADGLVVEQQPHGSHPHLCLLVNGSLIFGPTRDYLWEPESVETGTETLKAHIEKLNEKREELVQKAAFIFQEVALRENKYLALEKVDRGTETGRKSRKAMELLSSMHSNIYTEIAELDWLISDSKKMLLQLESNGTWMPKSQTNPDPKVLEAVRKSVTEHKKHIEMMLQQIGYMVVPHENRAQMEENVQELKENAEATADLVEYFDDFSKPK